LRHLLQVDTIEAETWVGTQCGSDLVPERDEMLGVDRTGKALFQKRRIVIAEIRPEPGQTADHAAALDRQRQDEEKLSVLVTPHDDGRYGAAAPADMALPGGEKAVGLEHGAVGVALEGLPLRLDRGQVVVNLEPYPGAVARTDHRERRAG
jgi:hypothetical protein